MYDGVHESQKMFSVRRSLCRFRLGIIVTKSGQRLKNKGFKDVGSPPLRLAEIQF